MLLCDREIKELVRTHGLIEGFSEARLSSYGYDLALSKNFLIPQLNYEVSIVDPLNLKVKFRDFTGDFCIIPPNSFILGCSLEWLNMPNDLTGICQGRSTYARCGIITNTTPLEAGWRGRVTIEISSTNQLPSKVYANKGIVQVLFLKGGSLPDRTYTEKGGRYQNQEGITLPKGL